MNMNMNKTDYLNSPTVKEFMQWIERRMVADSFLHKFTIKKWNKPFCATSLFSAYEQYWWPFKGVIPGCTEKKEGCEFKKTFDYLTQLSEILKQSVSHKNLAQCQESCIAVLKWGGVKARNSKIVQDMEDQLCDYLSFIIAKLDPDHIATGPQDNIIMNSGFTKIYALLVKDFIIYDGRVGAALGLFVRWFCEEYCLPEIPKELLFGYGKGKEYKPVQEKPNRRDPSLGIYKFPQMTGKPEKHLHYNIRAGWLLKEIVHNTNSEFGNLPWDGTLDMRLWALQSALFMIGYDVRGC